jgi:hypoxanthine phosphoribosyltransferase
MMTPARASQILATAERLVTAEEVAVALARIAGEVSAALRDRYPLVLSVMGGAVVFTGNLLPLLTFPLDFDYVHVTRYGDAMSGGEVRWIAAPRESIAGRTVLVLDDILDEGITLAAIRQRMLDNGAAACLTAVFADKDIGKPKPIAADFVGIRVPNRYVFGFGMDVYGAWRNLPAIYALKDH